MSLNIHVTLHINVDVTKLYIFWVLSVGHHGDNVSCEFKENNT